MGYIEYLKGGLDENGNMKWYYRFFSNNHEDITDYFTFIGRKVRLKYCTAILIYEEPQVLYNTLSSNQYQTYVCEDLDKAEKARQACSKGQNCSVYCDNQFMLNCKKLNKRHEAYNKNRLILEAIQTPYANYINKGTKQSYDKKASSKLQFSSFDNVNKLNKSHENLPIYTIVDIVNNGNTCKLIDMSGKEHIIDIAVILRNILDLKVYITNLDFIKGWKNFG